MLFTVFVKNAPDAGLNRKEAYQALVCTLLGLGVTITEQLPQNHQVNGEATDEQYDRLRAVLCQDTYGLRERQTVSRKEVGVIPSDFFGTTGSFAGSGCYDFSRVGGSG